MTWKKLIKIFMMISKLLDPHGLYNKTSTLQGLPLVPLYYVRIIFHSFQSGIIIVSAISDLK